MFKAIAEYQKASPGYVIKKSHVRGPKHGASALQPVYSKAKELLQKAHQPKHGGHKATLERWQNMTSTARPCQNLGGLKSKLSRTINLHWKITVTQQPERKEIVTKTFGSSHWTKKVAQAPRNRRPDYVEAKREMKRLHDEHVKETSEGIVPIHHAQRLRQWRGQQFEGLEEHNYRIDPQTGWRFYPTEPQINLARQTPLSSSTNWKYQDTWTTGSWDWQTSSWSDNSWICFLSGHFGSREKLPENRREGVQRNTSRTPCSVLHSLSAHLAHTHSHFITRHTMRGSSARRLTQTTSSQSFSPLHFMWTVHPQIQHVQRCTAWSHFITRTRVAQAARLRIAHLCVAKQVSSTSHVSFLAAPDTDHKHKFSLTHFSYLSDNHTNTHKTFGTRWLFTLRWSTAEWRINTNPTSHRVWARSHRDRAWRPRAQMNWVWHES